jgi:DNA-binding response OmpR family regulator
MRILLLDPAAEVLPHLESSLLSLGHEVMWSDEPRQALGLIAWPDALVAVVHGLDLDALALLRTARQLHPGLRLAMLVHTHGVEPAFLRLAAGISELLIGSADQVLRGLVARHTAVTSRAS